MSAKISKNPSTFFQFAVVFSLLSGCAALAHELLWTRRLIDLIGATTEATARVFGCFFLGLAIGAAISSLIANRIKKPWRFVAFTQIGIAVFSIPLLTVVSWSDGVWQMLGTDGLLRYGGLIKLILSLLILMPPSIIMGIVLPVLAQASLGTKLSLKVQGIWLYSVNTAGGVLGIFLASLFLIPKLGINGSLLAVILLNAVLGISCLIVQWKKNRYTEPEAPEPISKKKPKGTLSKKPPLNKMTYLIVFVSGFGILAVEILCLHLIRQIVRVSIYPETAVLACVISILALSSFLVPAITNRLGLKLDKMFPLLFVISGISFLAIPLLFSSYTEGLVPIFSKQNYVLYMASVFILTLVTMGPALFISGLIFPATFSHFEDSLGSDSKIKWGWLLAVNGLGGILGTEFSNYVLMPVFGMNVGIGVLGMLFLGIALLLHLYRNNKWTFKLSFLLYVFVFIIAFAVLFNKIEPLPILNKWRWNYGDHKTLDVNCGPEGVVSVIKRPGGRILLFNNYYSLGGDAAPEDEVKQALLPLILHPDPEDVATIGVATGITASGFLFDTTIQNIEPVEISNLVIKKAIEYFSVSNNNLYGNKRVKKILEDGRIYINAANNQYDIILSDLFVPWGPGEGRLYSTEHFKATRRALKSGGIFCQWLPMHMFTAEQFKVVSNTFTDVYNSACIFKHSLGVNPPWIAMVGFKDSRLNMDVPVQRIQELSAYNEFPFVFEELNDLLLGIVTMDMSVEKEMTLNTLNNAWVEINASKRQVTDSADYIKARVSRKDMERYLSD